MAGAKGRSGRRPKPVDQHRLEGTFQNCRHGGRVNPLVPGGEPRPPKRLTKEGRREWRRMIGRLREMHTTSPVYAGALFLYCELWAQTERLADEADAIAALINELDETRRQLRGVDRVACIAEITKLRQLAARYVTQIRQGRMAQRIFLVEFGMTPASRGRVHVADQADRVDPNDPFAEFDAGGRDPDDAAPPPARRRFH